MGVADAVNVVVLVGTSCNLDSRAEVKGRWGFVTEGTERDVGWSGRDREGTSEVRRAMVA